MAARPRYYFRTLVPNPRGRGQLARGPRYKTDKAARTAAYQLAQQLNRPVTVGRYIAKAKPNPGDCDEVDTMADVQWNPATPAPDEESCPLCAGTGRDGRSRCAYCFGDGVIPSASSPRRKAGPPASNPRRRRNQGEAEWYIKASSGDWGPFSTREEAAAFAAGRRIRRPRIEMRLDEWGRRPDFPARRRNPRSRGQVPGGRVEWRLQGPDKRSGMTIYRVQVRHPGSKGRRWSPGGVVAQPGNRRSWSAGVELPRVGVVHVGIYRSRDHAAEHVAWSWAYQHEHTKRRPSSGVRRQHRHTYHRRACPQCPPRKGAYRVVTPRDRGGRVECPHCRYDFGAPEPTLAANPSHPYAVLFDLHRSPRSINNGRGWRPRNARAWLKRNGYEGVKLTTTPRGTYLRASQSDATSCGSWQTLTGNLPNGVRVLACRSNPRDAAGMVEIFTGRPARGAREVRALELPAEVADLGALHAVEYINAKHGDAKSIYRHEFKRPLPRLVTDPQGRGLWIVGGGFSVRDVGVVG